MSKAWTGGSTRRWRKVRLSVLNRDRWVCQICHRMINPLLRKPHPYSATVHHTRGKRYGDDPAYLVAAHQLCNQRIGDPARHDPEPTVMTQW